MNHKLIIGGVAVLVLIGGIYGFTRTKHAEAPASVPSTEVAENNTDNTNTTPGDDAGATTAEIVPEQTKGDTSVPSTPQAKAPTRPSLPYTATVVYNGENFIPEEVTVIEGGTVKFVNTSDKKMWIATDNHPTHDRYPIKSETSCSGNAFDQCTSVTRGGSWSFTFDRTSTWGYHNHSGAAARGKVVVMTAENYLERLTKDKPEWSNI